MKTQVAGTSRAAYDSLVAAGGLGQQERKVMSLFDGQAVALTREQIALRTGLKESAVCGRVNALVGKHRLEEIEGGRTSTGRAAKLVRLPRLGQQMLFEVV